MAEKQIPGDIYYDFQNDTFRTIEGLPIIDAAFDEEWDHRSDEFPEWRPTAVNFVLVDDTIKEPKIVETAVTLSIPPSQLIAFADPGNADLFEPLKRTFDVWVVRLKGEQTTIGELKCTFDNGVETTAAYLISSGAEIDPNTYTKLWKFNISRVNEELAAAATRDNSDSTELRQAKNTIASLDTIVKQLERKVNPAKDSQITSLSWQLADARKTISTQRGELKELRTRLDLPDLPVAARDQFLDTIATQTRQIANLQEMNDNQFETIKNQRDSIAALRSDITQLEGNLREIRRKHNATGLPNVGQAQEIERLRIELVQVKASLTIAENALKSSNTSHETLIKQATENLRKIRELTGSVEYYKGQRDAQQKEKQEHEITIRNLHKEAQDLAEQLSSKKDTVVGKLGHSSSDRDTIERLSKSVAQLSQINDEQAQRIQDGTKQLTELKIELRAKANLEKRVTELTNDLLRTANERDNGVMEAVRARLPDELAKATKELSEEKARLKEVEKETDIAHNRETRKLEKKIKKLKGALRAAANDIELVEELKDANTQLTERLSELSIRAARLEAATSFDDEQEQYASIGLAPLDPIHSSYDNFPTVHITINGGVVNFEAPIINQ